eukprot:12900523-Prorocentrum_lima.AAC.1
MPTLPALSPRRSHAVQVELVCHMIKLKKKVIIPRELPQLDRCECGHDMEQHFHVMKSMFHSRTYEHNEIHAQANLALIYLCARQDPLLEWG